MSKPNEAEYIEAAKTYIEKSKARPRWIQFLHGIAATHESSSALEKNLLNFLKTIAPDPETARKRCPIDPETIYNTRNKYNMAGAICNGAEMWEDIKKAMERCDFRWISENVFGLRYKGADMTLLLAGCNTVVPDKHMLRLVKPDITEKEIHKIQHHLPTYNAYKEKLMRMAEKEGLPYNIWHVKEWLKRADAPTIYGPKKWVEMLFAD